MNNLYVVDTCALISYFQDIFEVRSSISSSALDIIDNGFNDYGNRLVFPSAVFVELFIKWFRTEEMASKIYWNVYYRIKNAENMQIRSLDREILTCYYRIVDIEKGFNFDGNDKQVFATAMALECTLISSDIRLFKHNLRKSLIPDIVR